MKATRVVLRVFGQGR